MKLIDIKSAVTSSDGKTTTMVVVYGDEVLWTMIAERDTSCIGWSASIKNKTETIWKDTETFDSKEEAILACISQFEILLRDVIAEVEVRAWTGRFKRAKHDGDASGLP